jgi:hypothetical protein
MTRARRGASERALLRVRQWEVISTMLNETEMRALRLKIIVSMFNKDPLLQDQVKALLI